MKPSATCLHYVAHLARVEAQHALPDEAQRLLDLADAAEDEAMRRAGAWTTRARYREADRAWRRWMAP
jgi:hypothetical protein